MGEVPDSEEGVQGSSPMCVCMTSFVSKCDIFLNSNYHALLLVSLPKI